MYLKLSELILTAILKKFLLIEFIAYNVTLIALSILCSDFISLVIGVTTLSLLVTLISYFTIPTFLEWDGVDRRSTNSTHNICAKEKL